eukprot:5558025-Lingulodinium_polyedra.AAC.1
MRQSCGLGPSPRTGWWPPRTVMTLRGWDFEVDDGSVAYLQEDRRLRCQRARPREMPGLLVPPERIG